MKPEEFRKLVREEVRDYTITEGIASWLIDKVADGFKWYANKKADYQYDALLNSKEFRSMASRFGYKDEESFIRKAKELIKKDPKKFAEILAYDVRKGKFSKYFE
jgi:hypothetical protein